MVHRHSTSPAEFLDHRLRISWLSTHSYSVLVLCGPKRSIGLLIPVASAIAVHVNKRRSGLPPASTRKSSYSYVVGVSHYLEVGTRAIVGRTTTPRNTSKYSH